MADSIPRIGLYLNCIRIADAWCRALEPSASPEHPAGSSPDKNPKQAKRSIIEGDRVHGEDCGQREKYTHCKDPNHCHNAAWVTPPAGGHLVLDVDSMRCGSCFFVWLFFLCDLREVTGSGQYFCKPSTSHGTIVKCVCKHCISKERLALSKQQSAGSLHALHSCNKYLSTTAYLARWKTPG